MSEEILSPPPSLLLSPMSLLHHLSAFRVLVCKAPICKHALRPGGIADHLLGKHKISSKMRKPFLDYTATLDIVGPEDVQNPTHYRQHKSGRLVGARALESSVQVAWHAKAGSTYGGQLVDE